MSRSDDIHNAFDAIKDVFSDVNSASDKLDNYFDDILESPVSDEFDVAFHDHAEFTGVFDEHVPHELWNNADLNTAFEIGFGHGGDDVSLEELMEARQDFLDIMYEYGIDIGEFWNDWRDAYNAA